MADEAIISWHVATHEHKERSADWFWGLGLAAGAGAVASIFFGNFLLAIILVIGAGAIGYLAARGPREHSVSLGSKGISLDGTLYPYQSLHSFWVDHSSEPHGTSRLFVTTGGLLSPHLSLPLDGISPEAVRAYLMRYVAEEEQGPEWSDHLAEMLGL